MPCYFLRLAGCNLACVWCDTPYTWDWTRFDPKREVHPMPVEAVAATLEERARATGVRSLVVSGGEPLLQQAALEATLRIIYSDWHVEVETAGTIAPTLGLEEVVDRFNVSPKLAHSGNAEAKRYRADALDALAEFAHFKFVVQQVEDFEEIDRLVERHRPARVYIMPEGQTREEVGAHFTQAIVEAAIGRGYWITPRLHVDIWGSRRGV